MVRRRARRALVAIGEPAAGALIEALSNRKIQVRWEAGKALTEIPVAAAADALVTALEDNDDGVSWLAAAEALIALRRVAVEPLLRALVKCPDSDKFRRGVHHVLRAIRLPDLGDVLLPVRRALEDFDWEESAPVATNKALRELRRRRLNQGART